MGLYQNIRNRITQTIQPNKSETRGLANTIQLLQALQGSQYGEPDFFQVESGNLITTGDDVLGITDSRISPRDIFDMVYRDTYFSGLFEQLIEAIFKNSYIIVPKLDSDGNPIGNEDTAKLIRDRLDDHDYARMIERYIYGLYGDGGGNVLFFTTKVDGRITVRLENFLDGGRIRVKVFGDDSLRTIRRYEVLDASEKTIFNLDPKKNFLKHERYKHAGDYRFSSNPAKRAVFWFILKKYIAGSNLGAFKNGFQDNVLGAPDYSALTSLVSAMNQNKPKVSAGITPDYLADPIKFLAKQSELDDEILREVAGNAAKSNTFLKLKMPYNFQRVGRNNQSMRSLELIDLCDKQMGFALRTSKGLINTENSKFSNAEIEVDNWNKLVLDPLKTRIERITESFILPVISPEFDSNAYRVRFGRDPDAEDLEIFRLKTDRNLSIGDNLLKAQTIVGWEFDVEKNKWVRGDSPTVDVDQSLLGLTERQVKKKIVPQDNSPKHPQVSLWDQGIESGLKSYYENR